MCGITAFSGKEEALPFLLQGLSRLEYRGYDSAGVTLVDKDKLFTIKTKGRLQNLIERLDQAKPRGCVGIGHTRWATHGIPSNLNSHPHTNNDNTISLVHNGIIENYRDLKKELIDNGYFFHCIYVTKKDSPLVLGKNNHASFGASDIPALLDYTKDVYFIEDYEIVKLCKNNLTFYNQEGIEISKKPTHIPYDNESAKKGGYDTFMLKEIHEQPYVISETLRGRIKDNDCIVLPELDQLKEKFKTFNRVYFVACGTAYHACLSGANVMERLTKLPTFIQVASEFRYSNPIIDDKTLCIFVSQSGETADTLAALRLAKAKGCTTIAIANVLGSTISREAAATIYTCAGPEIAVASTKAYTTQIIVLLLLAMYIAQSLGKEDEDYRELIAGISDLPKQIEMILKDEKLFEKYAKYLQNQHDAYFIGRNLDYAIVLEGALKLKEVSYIHGDAYIAGELKHGPIALIEEGSVVIAVATQPDIACKTISNIQETIARGAKVILFTLHGQKVNNVDEIYYMPDVNPILQTILVAIPLQLISYYAAKIKGCDVDKPRNLAKSVTVE